ncbi:hypothetical protein RRG08_026117 [Elysia crispata]|uniref:Uncharacterized protein n=1 Tax=Elysia crispata TaxID=231223 RepID=A0AAE0YT55_9GAST|nr:hypothetical protein RRG08_026117 [Elysia crispata]
MGRQASLFGQHRHLPGLTIYTGAFLCRFLLIPANGSKHFRGGSTSVEILDHSHPEYYTTQLLPLGNDPHEAVRTWTMIPRTSGTSIQGIVKRNRTKIRADNREALGSVTVGKERNI